MLRELLEVSAEFEAFIGRIDKLVDALPPTLALVEADWADADGNSEGIEVPSGAKLRLALGAALKGYVDKNDHAITEALRSANDALSLAYIFEAALLANRFKFFQSRWSKVVIADLDVTYIQNCEFFDQLRSDYQSFFTEKRDDKAARARLKASIEEAKKILEKIPLLEIELSKRARESRWNGGYLAVAAVTGVLLVLLAFNWSDVKAHYFGTNHDSADGQNTKPTPQITSNGPPAKTPK